MSDCGTEGNSAVRLRRGQGGKKVCGDGGNIRRPPAAAADVEQIVAATFVCVCKVGY